MNFSISKIKSDFAETIQIGGSKSISNRLLIIKGLGQSKCAISNISESNDTMSLLDFVARIETCERSRIPMIIDVGNAGTVARFLSAYLSFREGKWLITGTERMKKRPMQSIVDSLHQLGAEISYAGVNGFLPLRITGSDIRGKEITTDVSESSQFVSAILMIAPYLENGLIINFKGEPVSMPYMEMTQKLMQKFGVHVNLTKEKAVVLPGKYEFHPCSVEPDWSSASYWYECVALSEYGEIFLPGYAKNSLQGDSIVVSIYEKLGVRTEFMIDGIKLSKSKVDIKEFSYDFKGFPDIVPTVMVTCAALGIDSEFININQLLYKESNRIEALRTELKKIGSNLTKRGNIHKLTNTKINSKNLIFNTYKDHRMAMCLAPLILKYDTIEIENPEIVNKSYPSFWDDFKNLILHI